MDQRLREQLRQVDAAGAGELVRLGRELERQGDEAQAVAAYDAAYGLDPDDADLGAARARLLTSLAVEELGITWRYVPAGRLLMGSEDGDPDERPVHPVDLEAYWIAETPVSWAQYHALVGWDSPPEGWEGTDQFRLNQGHAWTGEEWKTRLPFCEDSIASYDDWSYDGTQAETYRTKPVVAVTWGAVGDVCAHVSTAGWVYRLPTEAEWERAARGGLRGKRYPWGDTRLDGSRCDCDAGERLGIRPSRSTPPNGYGVYAMVGGVWEWTADRYDACWYARSPSTDVGGPEEGGERVIRGGSWSDHPGVCTVSFRASCPEGLRRGSGQMNYMTPNLGFRLVRIPAKP